MTDEDTQDFEPPKPPDEGDDAAGHEYAGEHELPPPATYAGRKRAEAGDEADADEDALTADEPQTAEEPDTADEPDTAEEPDTGDEPQAADEPHAPDDGATSDDLSAGFTEEFDEIGRELDAELAGLDEPEPEPASGEHEPLDADHEQPSAEHDAPPDEDHPSAEHEALDEEPSDEHDQVVPGISDPTVEAETLALADRAEAEEAALAGLRARTAQKGPKAGTTIGAATPASSAPVAAVAEEEEDEDEQPDGGGKTPRAKRLWPRFLAASMLIVVSMATATSVYVLLIATDLARGLGGIPGIEDRLVPTDGGNPQTILILGSDKRLDTTGDPGRSDTTILLHVDPDQDSISLLSIPRDLRVNIPGVGVDKFNAAYTAGGPKLTLEVVQRLTGLPINHVVNVNFTGFADAVDAIDCVYVDVDRRYYIPPETGTAEIDIEAGYQRLCGLKALQYVRFRHEDNDLVRSARQQDFVREARAAVPPGKLVSDREQLLDIFKKYTTSDNALKDPIQVIELIKTFYFVRNAPVSEVHFPAQLGTTYVTANDKEIKAAVEQFESGQGTPGERPAGEAPPAEKPEKPSNADQSGGDKPNGEKPDEPKPSDDGDHFEGPAMDDSTEQGKTYAHQVSVKKKHDGEPMIDFPIYYPTRLVPGSFIARDTRAFVIDGPDNQVYNGYKMVVDVPGDAFGHGLLDEFYGISGTNWVDAPFLENPSETRTIDGRDYLLFYDGDRLRAVGWKTGKAAYWINNTLLQSLEEGQMLSIATSMREFEEK